MTNIKIWNPYLIQIHIIDSCIMDCEYCYLGKKQNKFITNDDFKNFIDNLIHQTKDYWIKFHITLTGWDLWLYEKNDSLEKIFSYIKENENISGIFLMVNNLWYQKSQDYINLILDKLIWIQLNTDIIENRLQDIEYLIKISCKTYFKIMLSKNNDIEKQLNTIKRIFQIFNNNDNLYVSIDRLCPTSPIDIKNSLTKLELFRYLNIIKSNYWNKFITEDPFVKSYLSNNDYEQDSLYGCAIPFWWFSIFPNWEIKLCSRSYYINTWYNLTNFDFLKYLSSFYINRENNMECNNCSLFRNCQWWCPATRYINDKSDFTKKDIQCFLNL